jgi:hypothetical protein
VALSCWRRPRRADPAMEASVAVVGVRHDGGARDGRLRAAVGERIACVRWWGKKMLLACFSF